jgi:hybrid cluster-associated redox disulfide protein
MLSYGLHCIGCGMNAFETIEQGCMGHGMGDEEINSLIDELNEAYDAYKSGKYVM